MISDWAESSGSGFCRRGLIFLVACLVLLPLTGCFVYVTNPNATKGGGVTTLTIQPQGACVSPAGTQQFTATAAGRPTTAVDWYVDGFKGGSTATGSISPSGLYGAPAAPGEHVINAVSTVNSNASSHSTISVTTKPQLRVSPDSAAVPPRGKQIFQAQVCGVPDAQVSWFVNGVPGGNQTIGTVSGDGEYTAPAVPGTYQVQAKDLAGNTMVAASVTVSDGITIDFGSRAPNGNAISRGVLGINRVDWTRNAGDQQLVARAGFKISRSYADLPQIFTSTKPDWKKLDEQISQMQQSGYRVLLQLAYTPKWLQPKPNSCDDGKKAPPTDVNAWAMLAKQVVGHLDAAFPGVVSDYEIWNEPDTGGMCTSKDKLQTYLAIYAATAPGIKQQLSADGASARVGGPATATDNPAWISALTTSPATAPYVDFISYHNYIAGKQEINAKWDSYDGTASLYQMTQDGTKGAAAKYVQASKAIASGSNIQLYVDEFNTNWSFLNDCCRNDRTYAPVWNAVYVSDILNTVYWAGTHVPGQLTYYAANNSPFCVIGNLGSMDCQLKANDDAQPYPQYFVYQLLASNDYLGMNDGGYMAASISPLNRGAGLQLTAFFTPSQDSILIVNPTGATLTEVLNVGNSGLPSRNAMLYQVVNGQYISSTPLSLAAWGSGTTVNITAPPYSVLGLALK